MSIQFFVVNIMLKKLSISSEIIYEYVFLKATWLIIMIFSKSNTPIIEHGK